MLTEAKDPAFVVIDDRFVIGPRDRKRGAASRRRCTRHALAGGGERAAIAAKWRRVGVLVAACLGTAVAFACSAGAASRLSYEDTVKDGESSSVRVVVRRPAAFRINFKAPTAGRTRLFLEGRNAPQAGL